MTPWPRLSATQSQWVRGKKIKAPPTSRRHTQAPAKVHDKVQCHLHPEGTSSHWRRFSSLASNQCSLPVSPAGGQQLLPIWRLIGKKRKWLFSAWPLAFGGWSFWSFSVSFVSAGFTGFCSFNSSTVSHGFYCRLYWFWLFHWFWWNILLVHLREPVELVLLVLLVSLFLLIWWFDILVGLSL